MANLLNVLLNAVFSWGLAGAGSYEGAAGCALGTSVVRALMFIAIAFYILTMMDKRTRGTGAGLSAFIPGNRLFLLQALPGIQHLIVQFPRKRCLHVDERHGIANSLGRIAAPSQG